MGLFLLGRKLMQLAEDSLGRGSTATSTRLVLIDVVYHPGSSITEITERTGFPQSLVSASVAKLREFGVVVTDADPTDRRRTLVNAVPAALKARMGAGAATVEDILAKELPPQNAVAATDAVRLLAGLFTPKVLDQ